MRKPDPSTRPTRRPRFPGPISLACAVLLAATAGCGSGSRSAELRPDSLLQAELGLTDRDEVHRVTLTGGEAEVLDPVETQVPPDAWVEFATTDWRVHVVRFEVDSLSAEARAFLEETDQVASPPLVDKDSRFVVSFADAPAGRYPFVVEGNGEPARGVVAVVPKR